MTEVGISRFPATQASGHAGASYIYGADIVRLSSAVLVAMFHLSWHDRGAWATAWYGWVGVQVFFVISGMVISRSAAGGGWGKFAESRFMRLYPAAWICAGISVAVMLAHRPAFTPELLLRIGSSLTLYPSGPFIASAYWTLPIEISFYALVFALLLFRGFAYLERVAIGLAIVSAIYIVAYTMQRAAMIPDVGLEFGYGWKNDLLLRHGIYFSFGIFLSRWSEGVLSRAGALAWALCAFVAPLEIACRSFELLPEFPGQLSWVSTLVVPIGVWLAACAALAASLRWAGLAQRLPQPVLRAIRLAGLTTYPLYLVHEHVGTLAKNALLWAGLPLIPAIAGAIVLSGLVALAVASVFEPWLRSRLRALFHFRGGWASAPLRRLDT